MYRQGDGLKNLFCLFIVKANAVVLHNDANIASVACFIRVPVIPKYWDKGVLERFGKFQGIIDQVIEQLIHPNEMDLDSRKLFMSAVRFLVSGAVCCFQFALADKC